MSWPLLFIFFSLNLFAETELDTIEVDASKDIERFTFGSSEVISAQQLETRPTGLMSPALKKVPGIIPSQNGGPGGRISFFIRGTESRHVLLTLDGLKMNDTSNTDRQFDAAFFMSPSIRQMAVHKGPQAVLYGSDALGGMIEIQTRKGEDAPETRFIINGGSFGTIDSSLSSDWKSQNENGTLTVSRFHSDGISRLNQKRFNATEKDATDITQLTSSSEHRWSKKGQTDLLLAYLHGKAEQDAFSSVNADDISRNDQYVFQQKTHYEIDSIQGISLRNGFNRHQRNNQSLNSGAEYFNGNLLQNELIHRLELPRLGVLSGVSSEYESAKAKKMDKASELNSAFLQSTYKINKLKLHVGGRADKHSKYGTFYTGSGGLAFENFSLQYSQGYKAPSLYQLYGPDSFGAPVGNPDLIPETNHSWEIAWKKKGEWISGGVALFQNRLANQFTYSFSQGYLNQQRYISEGIELTGKVKSTNMEVASSFTHLNLREEEAVVLRRPYNSAMVSFSYFPQESIELNLTERWFSSRKDLGSNNEIVKLNGYEVMDFGIKKTWERDEAGIEFKNILNREYEEIYGYSVLPRSVFAHYGHRF